MQIDKIIGTGYLGRNAGREVNDCLKKAEREVKIISPYLSPDYVKKLIKLNEKGVDVTLITCDNVEERGEFSKGSLLNQNVEIDERRKIIRSFGIGISSIFGVVSLLFGFLVSQLFILFGICLTGFVVFLLMRTKFYSYSPIFKLKVFDSSIDKNGKRGHLIHSKVYLIDDVAFIGSLNFTRNGFINSYESCVKIVNKEAVEKIRKEVEWVFENYELGEVNLNDWGKELFEEPRN